MNSARRRAPHGCGMPVAIGGALLCAAASSLAAMRHRGRARIAWFFLGAAALWWPVTEPSLGLGMAGTALLATISLVLVPTGARRRSGAGDAVEGAVTATALLILAWMWALEPAMLSSAGNGRALVAVIDVGADVVLGAGVLMLLTRAVGWARLPLLTLACGLASLAAVDAALHRSGSVAHDASGPYAAAIAACFIVITIAAAIGALRPVRGSAHLTEPSRMHAVTPYLLGLFAMAAYVLHVLTGHTADPFVLVAIPVVFALLVVRQQLMLADREDLLKALGAREQELSHRAEHDPLTDLPNRAYFLSRLERALSWRRRGMRDGLCTVMLIDLDDFESVNALIGHKNGDRVLTALADRLRDSLRAVDTVARIGGDEFGILFDEVPFASDLLEVGERLVDTLHIPIEVDGERIAVEASVGIALCGPNDSRPDAGEMLRRADIALRMAKQNGRGAFGVFEPSLRVAQEEPRRRHGGLQRALGLRQFLLEYQPIIDVAQRRVVGAEALLRWQHPEAGLLSPVEFLSDLEDVGLIRSVGRWVVEEAVAETAAIRNRLGVEIFVTVNVSSLQLHDDSFVDAVHRALGANGLPGSALIVELTESGNVAEDAKAIERLRRLRSFGVRLAIDDFGTGYSSMSYLHRFPVDVLKIDKSFVDDLDDQEGEATLAGELLRFGTTLGLLTIAEGVESDVQHAALVELGCPLAQGFHYAGPLSKEQLSMLLRAQHAVFPERQTA